MNETWCDAYTSGDEDNLPSMEDVLFASDYSPYTGDIQLDSLIYCGLFRCGEVYCTGIGL